MAGYSSGTMFTLDEDFPETVEIHDGVVMGPRRTIVGETRGSGRISSKSKLSYHESRRGVEPFRAKYGVRHSSTEPRPETARPASEVG
jgi:hypothetical protein